jgi:hypothetical protein
LCRARFGTQLGFELARAPQKIYCGKNQKLQHGEHLDYPRVTPAFYNSIFRATLISGSLFRLAERKKLSQVFIWGRHMLASLPRAIFAR